MYAISQLPFLSDCNCLEKWVVHWSPPDFRVPSFLDHFGRSPPPEARAEVSFPLLLSIEFMVV